MADTGTRLVSSALGAGIAELFTLPTDVAKVRLQVQSSASSSSSGATVQYRGMADCIRKIAQQEGVPALWSGLGPALVRQISYSSLTFALYEPVRDFYSSFGGANGSPTFFQRLIAGGTSGGIAISVLNPVEVMKTQLQTTQDKTMSAMDVARRVMAKDGVVGFWAGLKPNIARTFLVNAAELGTYDEAKVHIRQHLGDGMATHVASSGVAGFCSACIATPADVVKTRFMNAAGRENAYRGIIHTGVSIVNEEGPVALYKGFTPILIRKLAWCSVFFVCYERLREMAKRS